MSVYKEVGYLAREIENKSSQIYPDAADYGAVINDYNDPLIVQTKAICEMFQMDLKTERYSTGATQTYSFDGGVPAVLEAGFETAQFVFVTMNDKRFPNAKGYLYVTTNTSQAARQEAAQIDY